MIYVLQHLSFFKSPQIYKMCFAWLNILIMHAMVTLYKVIKTICNTERHKEIFKKGEVNKT